MASEEEMMRQMMGFSGFGAAEKPQVKQFEKVSQQRIEEAKRKDDKDEEKTKNQTDFDVDDDEEVIGPLPPGFGQSGNEEKSKEPKEKGSEEAKQKKDSDEESEDDEEENIIQKIPRSHEITLKHGTKVISALALDPSGSRLASGGYNYDVKFWDFNSMDINLRAFRTIEPFESHWIHSLKYSITGDMLLIGAGNAQPKVLDRDGHQVYECKKGDQYIVDMRNTKGHISMVRNCCWDPKDRNMFISSGDDGTVRLWDINTVRKNKEVIVVKDMQRRKTGCTYCTFNHDGKLILAAGQDGSIQGWDTKKMFVNTSIKIPNAHTKGSETSCLTLAHDNRTLISRGGDDTVKQWDLRNVKKPVATMDGLTTYYSTTMCSFSPDEKLLLTGTSTKKEGEGSLLFLERDTFETVYQVKFGKGVSVVTSLWHPKLNQIVVGLSDGNVRVLFDPTKSRNGATLCVGKVKHKRVDLGEEMIKPQIVNPHSLRMYREKKIDSVKKMKAKMRKDPITSHKPEAPMGTGHGAGGRLKEGMSLTGFVVKNIALAKKDDLNPREALLRHAKEAEKNPFWISPAYASTQPKKIFKEESSEEEEEDDMGPLGKRQKTQ
ncbi:WD repeat-containing protein 70-like [Clytia hemisphaerica]|uniref:WD repeat-containing protein 70 n=1 Tax=Clytia hemisphaerica TaxID=252671 RepID=A0A7M5WZD3_9CNID